MDDRWRLTPASPSPPSLSLSGRGGRPYRVMAFVCGIAAATVLAGCHRAAYRTKRIPGVSESRQADQTVQPVGAIRAIWVTRWDYKSPGDVAKIMHNCRTAGFNTVLFQVRGNGTAFYRSKLEPWADELGGRDPGFDPLAVACREAHRRGLSLHAWANVMPGWRGSKPPINPKQLYRAHPDWFWRDAAGRRQPLGWYNSVNACYPEVRQYLVAVMREIVENYSVDGLHLDYIRFPNEWHKSYGRGRHVPDYPRDPQTLAMFIRATGHTPDSAPRRWDEWRTDQVTQLVRGIRAMILEVKPQVRLSAAVGASPGEAKSRHFQDSRRWIADRLLDAVYPMNYARDMSTFTRRIDQWSAMRLSIPVVTGVMIDRRDGSAVIEQLSRVRRGDSHFAVFAYSSLFERFDHTGQPIRDGQSAARAALRQRLIPYVCALSASPA